MNYKYNVENVLRGRGFVISSSRYFAIIEWLNREVGKDNYTLEYVVEDNFSVHWQLQLMNESDYTAFLLVWKI